MISFTYELDGNAVVIDSTGAMSLYPVRLSELKRVTGYKFHSMKLNQGETATFA